MCDELDVLFDQHNKINIRELETANMRTALYNVVRDLILKEKLLSKLNWEICGHVDSIWDTELWLYALHEEDWDKEAQDAWERINILMGLLAGYQINYGELCLGLYTRRVQLTVRKGGVNAELFKFMVDNSIRVTNTQKIVSKWQSLMHDLEAHINCLMCSLL